MAGAVVGSVGGLGVGSAIGAVGGYVADKIGGRALKVGINVGVSTADKITHAIQRTQGTKYAQILQKAAQRGPQASASTYFLLSQRDPEFRKLVDKEDGNE